MHHKLLVEVTTPDENPPRSNIHLSVQESVLNILHAGFQGVEELKDWTVQGVESLLHLPGNPATEETVSGAGNGSPQPVDSLVDNPPNPSENPDSLPPPEPPTVGSESSETARGDGPATETPDPGWRIP